jgi:hypothetical protein
MSLPDCEHCMGPLCACGGRYHDWTAGWLTELLATLEAQPASSARRDQATVRLENVW